MNLTAVEQHLGRQENVVELDEHNGTYIILSCTCADKDVQFISLLFSVTHMKKAVKRGSGQ